MENSIDGTIRALERGELTRAQFVRRGIAGGLSLSAIGALLSACGSGGSDGTKAATGAIPASQGKPPAKPTGTIVYGNAEPPSAAYWDPAAGFGLADEQVASLVHDSLMRPDESGTLQPWLATRADRVDDRTVNVTLREGVRFQNGAPLTADDVKASYERLGAKGSRLAQAFTVAPLHVNVKSPTELEIVTDKPFGPLENALGYIKILPQSSIDNPSSFRKRALGSGPYKFVSYQGNTITLEANEDYWGAGPYAKTIRIDYIEDPDARLNALLTGDIQILSRAGADQVARIKGNADYYSTRTSPIGQINNLYQHNGPLRDQKLRQALIYAIDRETIAKTLMGGINAVGQSLLPTTTPFYTACDPSFAFDPDRARALVREIGPVTLRMASTSLIPRQNEIDQAIASYLEAVGITVKVTKLEVGAYRTNFPQYDLSLNTNNSFTGDPDFMLGVFLPPTNEAAFHLTDQKLSDLVLAQRSTVGSKREAKMNELQQYAWNQQTQLWLSDDTWPFLVSSKVRNYKRAPIVGETLAAQAWIEA